MMNIDEAKALMKGSSLDQLKDIVCIKKSINISNKTNNDILMNALCRAVTTEGVIRESSLDDKTVKLLNSPTNTLSQSKLFDILNSIREFQPVVCVITLMNSDMSDTLKTWIIDGTDKMDNFHTILDFVLTEFDITPSLIRSKMTNTLKPTIVNNISQFVAKYQNVSENKHDINVSINTINRLVNMMDHLLLAEFYDLMNDVS